MNHSIRYHDRANKIQFSLQRFSTVAIRKLSLGNFKSSSRTEPIWVNKFNRKMLYQVSKEVDEQDEK